MNKKSYFLLYIFYLACVLVFGCNNKDQNIKAAPEVLRQAVTDDLGRKVEVVRSVERIVSLAPSITETLFALGIGEKVVGVTSYCNYPSEAQSKTQVGDTLKPNIEQIISLKPDLVLITTASQLEQFTTKLSQAGIAVFVVKAQTVEDVFKSIASIGKLTGREQQAKAILDNMNSRIEAVKKKVEGKTKPKVFIVIGTEPLITAGRDSFITDLVKIAGGDSISADVASEWPIYSAETVIAKKPDVILLPIDAHGSEAERRRLPEGLHETPATKQGRTYTIDGELILRPGPRIVDGIEEMAELFYLQ
ncbi:MAG: ABC transporter substrate-binding protein [Blastocatellia bacterium]|nr:ABC transporter substrate-binding protein [Blastocatellia bacterium]